MTQDKWASKASIMTSYAEYSRNSYSAAIFGLERHINNYPADKNLSYAHYLIAICFYEQILDEKKDLAPLLKAKEKFEFLTKTYPNTDYGTDARFKLDLIIDQLAAKEMSVARFYMKTEKWIAALNRLKNVVEKYDRTVFVEEALYRLVEVYYRLGLESEAKQAAAILGYNYQSGVWYEKSYKVFNKKYKPKKFKKENNLPEKFFKQSKFRKITKSLVSEIITARVEEIMKIIKKEIYAIGPSLTSGQNIFIVGGGSYLPHLNKLCSTFFDTDIKILGILKSNLDQKIQNQDRFDSCKGALKIIFYGWETEAIPENVDKKNKKWRFFSNILGN